MSDIANFNTQAEAVASASVDALDDFVGELEEARTVLERFGVIGRRLDDATSALERADSALQTFLADEDAKVRAWAETGAGEPPARDGGAYQRLARERDAARNDRNAAESAERAIAPAKLAAIGRVNEIRWKIELTLANICADEAGALARSLDADLEQFGKRLARVLATREALIEKSEGFARNGDLAHAAHFGQLAHRLDIPWKLQIAPTRGEVLQAAAEWRSKLQPAFGEPQ